MVMREKILGFDEFWWHLLAPDTDLDKSISDMDKQVKKQQLDAFYQHIELELDEKHKVKRNIKLDTPTKNQLDKLIADYELAKLKREYLTRRLKTKSTGPEGFAAQI